MKKVFTLVCLLACTLFANAQDREFKPFKVDLALGYAIPSGYGGGVLFAIEPKYAIQDQLAVGVRLEVAALANIDVAGESASVKGVFSYAPTLDYYFSTNKSRVFVGAGAGLYQFAAATVNSNTQPSDNIPYYKYNKFGFFPRVGAELAHFRIAAEYNILPKELSVSNSYFSIKLGIFIGGGKQ